MIIQLSIMTPAGVKRSGLLQGESIRIWALAFDHRAVGIALDLRLTETKKVVVHVLTSRSYAASARSLASSYKRRRTMHATCHAIREKHTLPKHSGISVGIRRRHA